MENVSRLDKLAALNILRHAVSEGIVIPGAHFRQEMKNEAATLEDVYSVLRNGQIYDEPEFAIKFRDWRYKVEGYEPEGKWLCIVFSIEEVDSVFLITVFSIEHRRKR